MSQPQQSIFFNNAADGSQKEIKKNGDFIVNGDVLGTGKWATPSRFEVWVEAWGRWWLGGLVENGMNSAAPLESPGEVLPTHFEPFTYGPGINVPLVEHKKTITPLGDFSVEGKILGFGNWVSDTRFMTEVPVWGRGGWVC